MKIVRSLEALLLSRLDDHKVIIILGSRQVGKTTLIKALLKDRENVLYLTGDDASTIAMFKEQTIQNFIQQFSAYRYLVIDEAQRIPEIGISLKLITDNIDNLKLIVTGSSALDLANNVNEPLTGRKWEYKMYPLSFAEMVDATNLIEERNKLTTRMTYGYYPEVVKGIGDEKELLRMLTDSFLYKDILNWEGIQKPQKLIVLLKALALQVGSMVSINELSITVGLDKKTVEKYIELLEKVYVIFRLGSFNRNLRNELTQSQKFYFYDNGIRNSIIAAFQPLDLRNDIGALWENFVIAERKKYLDYNRIWANSYFWRTQSQQEVDLIEESDGMLNSFEIKWNSKAKAFLSKTFIKAYDNHTFNVIHKDNYWEFFYNKSK